MNDEWRLHCIHSFSHLEIVEITYSMANQLERWIQLVLGGVAGLKGCEFDPRLRQG